MTIQMGSYPNGLEAKLVDSASVRSWTLCFFFNTISHGFRSVGLPVKIGTFNPAVTNIGEMLEREIAIVLKNKHLVAI